MNWGHLFFNFSGRINRAKYWIAMLVYSAIYIVLAIVGYATDNSAIYQAINGMLNIVILISSLAVGVKRLHDRNKSGWYLVLFYIVPGILLVAGLLGALGLRAVKRGVPPVPEQAIAEAKLTTEAVKTNGHQRSTV